MLANSRARSANMKYRGSGRKKRRKGKVLTSRWREEGHPRAVSERTTRGFLLPRNRPSTNASSLLYVSVSQQDDHRMTGSWPTRDAAEVRRLVASGVEAQRPMVSLAEDVAPGLRCHRRAERRYWPCRPRRRLPHSSPKIRTLPPSTPKGCEIFLGLRLPLCAELAESDAQRASPAGLVLRG